MTCSPVRFSSRFERIFDASFKSKRFGRAHLIILVQAAALQALQNTRPWRHGSRAPIATIQDHETRPMRIVFCRRKGLDGASAAASLAMIASGMSGRLDPSVQGRTGDRALAAASGPTADKDSAAAQAGPAFAANSSAFGKRFQWFKGRQQSSRACPCRSICTSRSCLRLQERICRNPRLCTKRRLRLRPIIAATGKN